MANYKILANTEITVSVRGGEFTFEYRTTHPYEVGHTLNYSYAVASGSKGVYNSRTNTKALGRFDVGGRMAGWHKFNVIDASPEWVWLSYIGYKPPTRR